MHREAWYWILGGSTFSSCAHSINALTVFIEPFPWLRGPSCDSFNPEMFAECAGLGPQYKMVSHHYWTSGPLSPIEERHMHINMHIKGKQCISLRMEWSVKASEQATLLCILKRFRGLLSRTTPVVFFPQPQKSSIHLGRLQSWAICYTWSLVDCDHYSAVSLGPSPLSLSCFHHFEGSYSLSWVLFFDLA